MDESKIKPSEDDNALVKRLKQTEQRLDDCRQENMHFLFIAAHDLHAPVRKLTTFIERLKVRGTEFTEEERQLLFIRIEKTLAQMNNVIDGLTVLADLSVPTRAFEVTHLELVVQDALNKLDYQIKQNKPEIIVSKLPVLEINRNLMVTVFIQLVENALKFSGGRSCRIMISAEMLDSKYKDTLGLDNGKAYYKIQISDNGIGFNEASASKIFNPFERLHGNAGQRGAGMGLSICKKIIENHSGYIYAHGKENDGATIVIILPTTMD